MANEEQTPVEKAFCGTDSPASDCYVRLHEWVKECINDHCIDYQMNKTGDEPEDYLADIIIQHTMGEIADWAINYQKTVSHFGTSKEAVAYNQALREFASLLGSHKT